jgi:hypothetical protein
MMIQDFSRDVVVFDPSNRESVTQRGEKLAEDESAADCEGRQQPRTALRGSG